MPTTEIVIRKNTEVLFLFFFLHMEIVMFINIPDFDNDLGQMYPGQLEIKYAMGSSSVFYLDSIL